MSAPLISVIIPVYNTSEFLPACLDSVIKQSFAELEIICIDDGSTDKSGDILRQYAEQDIRIILHSQENLGASAAKNRGLALSSGEFLMIVDSDDILLPDALLKMYEAIKRDEADIVHGSYICRHYATGQRYITTANRALKTESQVFQTLLDRSALHDPWAKLFRKKLFVDHDLSWSESIRYSTDVLIVYQAFYFARRLRIIPDLVYEHTFLRPCSLTNSFSNETFVTDKVQTRADIANFLRSQGAWERYKDAICSTNNRLFKNALLYRMIVLAKGASPHSIKNIVIACKNNLPEFIITEKEIVRIIFRFLDENVFAIAGYSNVERMQIICYIKDYLIELDLESIGLTLKEEQIAQDFDETYYANMNKRKFLAALQLWREIDIWKRGGLWLIRRLWSR